MKALLLFISSSHAGHREDFSRRSALRVTTEYRRTRQNYVGSAALLVVLSFVVLWLLGMGSVAWLQAWRLWLVDAKIDLPTPSERFMGLFTRIDVPLAFLDVLMWFAWPMAYVLVHCHARWGSGRTFAIRFGLAFGTCWLVVGLFLAASLMICAMPLIGTLYQPFGGTKVLPSDRVITVLSWAIPTALAARAGKVWLPVWRARRRIRAGLCGHCGYDLRHHEAARCPECGVRKMR
jgi:hypothetical protein